MGTRIVSVALSLDGEKLISRVLLAIAAVMWAALAALAVACLARARPSFLADARTPPALTAVASTAVLGTAVTGLGWTWAAITLLVIALAWATVFPFGMYAACRFVAGTVSGASACTAFAQVWAWVAPAVWIVVFAAMIRATPATRT